MTDPWEDYPPIDPELIALLRAPIKLEPISPSSSPEHFFSKPMTRYKSAAGRPRQPRENQPRQNRGGHRAASVGARRNPLLVETLLLRIVPRRFFFTEPSLRGGGVLSPMSSGTLFMRAL